MAEDRFDHVFIDPGSCPGSTTGARRDSPPATATAT